MFEGGTVHGETDEFGHKAVTDTMSHHDYHATLLHLFGLEQKQVEFLRPNGAGSLLEDPDAQIVWKILTNGPNEPSGSTA